MRESAVSQTKRSRYLRCHMARWAPLVLLPVLGGCSGLSLTGWHRIDPPSAVKRRNPRAPVQVWSHGQVTLWRAVVMSPDSITGMPRGLSTKCDSCRRGVAWADADSIRVDHIRPVQFSLFLVMYLAACAKLCT